GVGGDPRIRAVIFDLWETLIDWDVAAATRMNARIDERVGFPFRERWCAAAGDGGRLRGATRLRPRVPRATRGGAGDAASTANGGLPHRADHGVQRGRGDALAAVGVRRS